MRLKSLKKVPSGTKVVPSYGMTLLDSLHKLGIKRPEIAKAVGCDESTLRRWNKGGALDPNGRNNLDSESRQRLLKLVKIAFKERNKELDIKFKEHMDEVSRGFETFEIPQYPTEATEWRFHKSQHDKRIEYERAYFIAWQQLALGGIDYTIGSQDTTD